MRTTSSIQAIGRWLQVTIGSAILLGASLGSVAAADGIEGTWSSKILSEVTIRACPAGYCGVISKIALSKDLLKPGEDITDLTPEQITDVRNQDETLRGRKVLGLQILTLESEQRNGRYHGSVYNPQDGRSYSGYLQVLDTNTMQLSGCVLFNLICRSENWVRVRN